MTEQAPHLRRLDEFRSILQNYTPSEHAKAVMADGPFVALSSVAGGGRNTLISYLLSSGAPYSFVVSDTTRSPKVRDGRLEQNGVQYFFRSEDDFLVDLRKGEFVEAEIIHNQQVSGVSIREVAAARARKLIPITDMELGGVEAVYRLKPNASIIGLLPPSFEDWQYRLTSREVMPPKEYKNRMVTAVNVLRSMLERDYMKFIISGDLNDSSTHLRDIVEKGIYSDDQHQHGLKLAETILQKTVKLVDGI